MLINRSATGRKLFAAVGAVLLLVACTPNGGGDPAPSEPPSTPQVELATDDSTTLVPAGSPDETTAQLTSALFVAAPAVVLVDSTWDGELPDLGLPVLIAPEVDPTSSPTPQSTPSAVAEEVERLGAQTALAFGPTATALAESWDVTVVFDAAELPAFERAEATPHTLVMTASPDLSELDEATEAAVRANVAAAGATWLETTWGDPRESRESVTIVAETAPTRVIGVGSGLGTEQELSERIATAATGTQLPGGGQIHHPGKIYIALYGHPGTPVLGVLGEQDLDGAVTRAQEHAAQYEDLTDLTVVPMFEIIATVALADPSPNGNYTNEVDPERFRPWVERAAEEEIYVVLDLQPGRADLLDQAKVYESLLLHPHVGLAIDPEWKLRPDQRPLRQIGQVQSDEINRVSEWLSDLTLSNDLPEKLLVLHQFQTRMLPDRDQIIMDRPGLQVLIHVDGQGPQGAKQGTWSVITEGAPPEVVWGWKNFYDEDTPMLTAEQTIVQVDPTPVMISYQ